VPDWAYSSGLPSYYLSLKTNRGYNANIRDVYKDKLSVIVVASSVAPPIPLGLFSTQWDPAKP
jgi:hypothetical protein